MYSSDQKKKKEHEEKEKERETNKKGIKEKKKEHEEKEKERETNKKGIKETKENDEEFYKNKYSSKPYKVDNMTRILPQQSRYISFIKDDRFVPVRKFKGNNGVVVLRDREPKEPVALIETVRQMKDVNAPLPTPFKVDDNVDFPSA